MIKNFFCVLLLMTLTSVPCVKGQSYNTLWKQVDDAAQKDLPQTQRKALEQIIKNAEREAKYGHLLKALLMDAKVAAEVSSDSLKPFVERLSEREEKAKTIPEKAILQTVLGRLYESNSRLLEGADEKSKQYYSMAMSDVKALAGVKADDYMPFVVKGEDARYYDESLLSVIAYETREFKRLHDYYLTTNNREAQLFSGIDWLRMEEEQRGNALKSVARFDSLMLHYADLPACGEAAIVRYDFLTGVPDVTARQQVEYIDEALSRWGTWHRMNVLRNQRESLTMPSFNCSLNERVAVPGQEQIAHLTELRNLQTFTLKVYRANVGGDTKLNPMNERDYKQLKSLLAHSPEQIITKTFRGKKDYEIFEDSFLMKGLPAGVYMLEFQTQPQTKVWRQFYYVSNVRLISQALPENKKRYVVVDAMSGHPLKGASLRITLRIDGPRNEQKTVVLTTDKNGECVFDAGRDRVTDIHVTSGTDRFCPSARGNDVFQYYSNERVRNLSAIYLDRAVYRPGQTVQVAAILYTLRQGIVHEVQAHKKVSVVLYDANNKVVGEQEAETDDYGTLSASFVLPAKGLTGNYSVTVDKNTQMFRVEEYKRPTFQVEFPKVNEQYNNGDTLTVQASATTYSGVPVQGAHVRYRVERRTAWWWVSYARYWQGDRTRSNEEVFAAETVTDEEGHFKVSIPMVMPESRTPHFYSFVVVADVTDASGETHQGQLSLPLGSRNTMFTVDLEEKLLADASPSMKFHLLNAAGNDVETSVSYRIDGGKWQQAQSNTAVKLPKLKSGNHQLQAVCGQDSFSRSFVVFSLNDKRPASPTDDWFYVETTQFADAVKPVTVQVGSSAEDVHIVYTFVAGDKVIEQGAVDRSNELFNRKFVYKEEYGNGLTLTFAWVHNNKVYTHRADILRPVPEKKLTLKWETFRDRLTPGQQEEWTLKINGLQQEQAGQYGYAQLMATLYDKSLDQLAPHVWSLDPNFWLPTAFFFWRNNQQGVIMVEGMRYPQFREETALQFCRFDETCFPQTAYIVRGRGPLLNKARNASLEEAGAIGSFNVLAEVPLQETVSAKEVYSDEGVVTGNAFSIEDNALAPTKEEGILMRENLQETAFFFPQLLSDSLGILKLKFTLPESLTTWRFMGLAHTKDMMYGLLEAEAVARKDVMIQPNMPRFLRQGDEAVIAGRVINTSGDVVCGQARLVLIDVDSETVVDQQQVSCTVEANSTGTVQFSVDAKRLQGHSLLVCRMMVEGDSFSDGEQHYLPVLANQERVTVTVPFVQTEPGTKTVSLEGLFPQSTLDGHDHSLNPSKEKLTIEYTNNPVWLMIQALPSIGNPYDKCVICQAASLYVNTLGRHLLEQNPNVKHVFEMWKNEEQGNSLNSPLQNDEELKELLLSETPWVMDADRERDQKHRLAEFFDKTLMDNRISSAMEQVRKLQNPDGSWSWWPGMEGSYYMTVEVSEMLIRLQQSTGGNKTVKEMLDAAFDFMDKKVVKMVDEMKKEEKKGHKQTFPTHSALQYLYVAALADHQSDLSVTQARSYLKNLLKKENRNLTIGDKAMASIVLDSGLFLKSLYEWSSYKEGVGRYYDTPRALSSWRDYRIPTQVAAIEAFRRQMPNDKKVVRELQQWLLHEKRAQAWDTPINSVNAIDAFLKGNQGALAVQPKTELRIDGQSLDLSSATAAVGMVKTTVPVSAQNRPKTFTAEKTSEGTSWGTVHAQFLQNTKDIVSQGSELSVKREILLNGTSIPSTLKKGARVVVRITVEAQRDMDFVEIVDKRAACMEPVRQLSGYHDGAYVAPKDNATHYFFNRMPKGRRVIETEYYIDRLGKYETGTCVVQCAYAPEFRASTSSATIIVTE